MPVLFLSDTSFHGNSHSRSLCFLFRFVEREEIPLICAVQRKIGWRVERRQMAIIAQVPDHLPNTEERCLKELFVNFGRVVV